MAHREIDTMIDGITGNNFLRANVRQDIIERTDGIPLFVEEITKDGGDRRFQSQRTAPRLQASPVKFRLAE